MYWTPWVSFSNHFRTCLTGRGHVGFSPTAISLAATRLLTGARGTAVDESRVSHRRVHLLAKIPRPAVVVTRDQYRLLSETGICGLAHGRVNRA